MENERNGGSIWPTTKSNRLRTQFSVFWSFRWPFVEYRFTRMKTILRYTELYHSARWLIKVWKNDNADHKTAYNMLTSDPNRQKFFTHKGPQNKTKAILNKSNDDETERKSKRSNRIPTKRTNNNVKAQSSDIFNVNNHNNNNKINDKFTRLKSFNRMKKKQEKKKEVKPKRRIVRSI